MARRTRPGKRKPTVITTLWVTVQPSTEPQRPGQTWHHTLLWWHKPSWLSGIKISWQPFCNERMTDPSHILALVSSEASQHRTSVRGLFGGHDSWFCCCWGTRDYLRHRWLTTPAGLWIATGGNWHAPISPRDELHVKTNGVSYVYWEYSFIWGV